jgi:putative transposase
MARKLRMESEGGVYHVLNRGNYRSAIFRADKTKLAFLKCLGEACEKTGWRVHAWCLMTNHYHLAVSTPQGNLVDGMRWFQGTFAVRFNQLRAERGHLFQGRYKSLLVDPLGGVGPLCHYIHLNPVRAGLCTVPKLPAWPWSSVRWLLEPSLRPDWYDPTAALEHAGGLKDSPAGRENYVEYLDWLAGDEPAQKEQRFTEMSKGWVIGSPAFAKEMNQEHSEVIGQGKRLAEEMRQSQEALWQEHLDGLLRKARKTTDEAAKERKSAPWKLAVAAVMKERTTATNRWLAEALTMGNLHEVSRRVAAWQRRPDKAWLKKLS